jgi:hypothetical protein
LTLSLTSRASARSYSTRRGPRWVGCRSYVERAVAEPDQGTSELDLLDDDLSVDLEAAEEEPDAFERASEKELAEYVDRLREIARAGEAALSRDGER